MKRKKPKGADLHTKKYSSTHHTERASASQPSRGLSNEFDGCWFLTPVLPPSTSFSPRAQHTAASPCRESRLCFPKPPIGKVRICAIVAKASGKPSDRIDEVAPSSGGRRKNRATQHTHTQGGEKCTSSSMDIKKNSSAVPLDTPTRKKPHSHGKLKQKNAYSF